MLVTITNKMAPNKISKNLFKHIEK